jgi:hypothetical protein
MPLWWGPGRNGSLLLSNNALPLNMVKISTPGPVLLPWIFSRLGLIRGEIFISQLEEDRAVPEPYLAGLRLTSRIFPWLELGLSRTAMFGGRNRPVTGKTIWDVITGRTENDVDDPGNQLASLDARVILPFKFQPIELYGEYGGEDEAGGFFSETAYLGGFYLPRLGPWHQLELTFEYANTAASGKTAVWYRNGNYPSGYTYKGKVLGHHVGTDGINYFGELRIHPFKRRRSSAFVSYNYEEHLVHADVTEEVHQFRMGVEAKAWKGLLATAFFEYDIWKNFQHVRGKDEDGSVLGVGVCWQF